MESYRNQNDRVCHRTILNAGYLDDLRVDQLNLIQKILTAKADTISHPLFELPYTSDPLVNSYLDDFYKRMITDKRIDIPVDAPEPKVSKGADDIQSIYTSNIRNRDVKEIGAEWLSYQAIGQLQIAPFLQSLGWGEDEIKLALSHIISRAVYPAWELETTRWMKENSSVCEVTGYDIKKITKGKITRPYKSTSTLKPFE